ncbi:MAG: hypothetical protein IJX99_05775 [Clostridia bacterium]|nr:hypothetical protein [Clostridia bacterium]
MKKSLVCLFMMVLMFVCMPIYVQAGTIDFYVQEINEKIKELEFKDNSKTTRQEILANESALLVFFSGDTMIKSSDLIISGDGIERDVDAEEDYIDEQEKYRKDYKEYVVCIELHRDAKDAVVYHKDFPDSVVNFELKPIGLNYRKVEEIEYDYTESEWEENSKQYTTMKELGDSYHYVRFYYNEIPLKSGDIDCIIFSGDAGEFSSSYVNAEYIEKADAWKISYEENVVGKVIIKTTQSDTYEMDLCILCNEIYFGDDDEKEIEEFVYVEGESETFELYEYTGDITVISGGDKVSYNKKMRFTVTSCEEEFTYEIEIEGKRYSILIKPLDFYAKEVNFDTAGAHTIDSKRLRTVELLGTTEKYFIFYEGNNVLSNLTFPTGITATAVSEFNGMNFDGTSLEGLEGSVYKIAFSTIKDNSATLEYIINSDTHNINFAKEFLKFYEYDADAKELIELEDEFEYVKNENEKFYIYAEGITLDESSLTMDSKYNYIEFGGEQLEVGSEIVDVIECKVVNNTNEALPVKYYISVEFSNTGISSIEIKISDNTDYNVVTTVPTEGFFRSYTDLTLDNYIESDDDEFEYIYEPGEVFYYVCENPKHFIKDSSIKTSKLDAIEVDVIDTGKDIEMEDGSFENRYAVRFKIPQNLIGNVSGKVYIPLYRRNNTSSEERIMISMEDIFSAAPIGMEDFDYSGEEYSIGFSKKEDDFKRLLESYSNEYLDGEPAKTQIIPIKIFSVTEEEYFDETLEVSTEEIELYDEIDSVDAYVAKYDNNEEKYEPLIGSSISVNVKREPSGNKRWYVEVSDNRELDRNFIVADIVFKNGEEITIGIIYSAYEVIETEIDLSSSNWKIKEINEFISGAARKLSANRIKIKLNPAIEYGSGDDEKIIKIAGEKEFYIDGNGATIIGSVEATGTVDSTFQPYHRFTNIHFVSASDDIENEDNVGIYGTGQLKATRCSFENYYAGVKLFDGKKSAMKDAMTFCEFKNNYYGILADARPGELEEVNYKFEGCRFVDNVVAIFIERREKIETKNELYEFAHCEFINNEEDIINETYKYLVYGCVFKKKSDSDPLVLEAKVPVTRGIYISYVYRDSILEADRDGFINTEISLPVPNTGYAPFASDGSLNAFTYSILKNVGINILNFTGKIDVIGGYDVTTNEFKLLGRWGF